MQITKLQRPQTVSQATLVWSARQILINEVPLNVGGLWQEEVCLHCRGGCYKKVTFQMLTQLILTSSYFMI